MLTLSRSSGEWKDTFFEALSERLMPGDVLVLNASRVIPSRLFGQRRDGSRVEVLLTEQTGEWEWRALTKPARKLRAGDEIAFASADGELLLEARITGAGEFGERLLRWSPVADFFARLDRIGHVPLPPYIHRPDEVSDRERYQTVFATDRGSVAAPTAGLHFTGEILDRIRARGVIICRLVLHVGLGTFQPVRVDRLEDIKLHGERYILPEETAGEVRRALRESRRVVAVGTTTVRVLEHCAKIGRLEAHSGETNLFIAPGYKFGVAGALITNFHLPHSTLLMLVSAFAKREYVLAAYRHAVESQYRFYSYGDCMFIE